MIEVEKVVGLLQGPMEFGPRALGGRSIIADARSVKMQSYLNLATKFRESFRPFAPIVLKEDAAEYFARAVDEPGVANRTFEIGGPDAPTWNEFWDLLKRTLGARRPTVHVPFRFMKAQAALTERLPGAPVTRDQLTMLALGDNIVTSPDAVEAFRLPLVPLEEQLRRAAS